MQNIHKALAVYEALEYQVVGEQRAKVRENIDRLRRIIFFFSDRVTPIPSHQIEYE